MTISPVSAIFPPHIRYQCSRKALVVFDRIAYLYEVVQYRKHQLENAQRTLPDEKGWLSGCVKLPVTKSPQPGANEKDAQNAWSILVFSAELESYLSEIIRFINLSFVLLNEDFSTLLVKEKYLEKKESQRIDTVSKYISFKADISDSKKLKALSLNHYNQILESSWNEWAEYISWIRNYLTHDIPLSGTIFDISQMAGPNEGFYCIRLPTKEKLSALNKKMDKDDFKAALEKDFSDGKFYQSFDLVKEYHPKFEALAQKIFDENNRLNAFWWAD